MTTKPQEQVLADELERLTFAASSYRSGQRIVGIVIPDNGGPMLTPDQAQRTILTALKLTPPPPSEPIVEDTGQERGEVVTQADRDRAAPILRLYGAENYAAICETGTAWCDQLAVVQAFARHRTESLSSLQAQVSRLEAEKGELVEALEPFAEICVNFVGEDEDDYDLYSPPRYERQKHVLVGHLRRARATLNQTTGDDNDLS